MLSLVRSAGSEYPRHSVKYNISVKGCCSNYCSNPKCLLYNLTKPTILCKSILGSGLWSLSSLCCFDRLWLPNNSISASQLICLEYSLYHSHSPGVYIQVSWIFLILGLQNWKLQMIYKTTNYLKWHLKVSKFVILTLSWVWGPECGVCQVP